MKILSLITSYRISISKHIELPLFTIILETIYSLYVYIFESKTSTKIARGRILYNQITDKIYGLSKSRFEIQNYEPVKLYHVKPTLIVNTHCV